MRLSTTGVIFAVPAVVSFLPQLLSRVAAKISFLYSCHCSCEAEKAFGVVEVDLNSPKFLEHKKKNPYFACRKPHLYSIICEPVTAAQK
jgi:hypothetical protein